MENRSSDTLWIDSITTHSGQKAVLDVYFSNTDTINALDVPLSYKYPDLIIDSISFVGSRIENRFVTIVNIDTAGAICHIGAFYFDVENEEVGPGSGLLARIHLTVPEEYPTRLIPFDTTRLHTGLTFVTKDDISYVPVFIMGYVDNTYTPDLDDSVWVEDVDISPGESFSVTIHSLNEEPIYNIKIPLEYQSDNIIFDSVTTSGTRALNAVAVDALANDELKKVLISLRFSDNQLLPSGSGPLAVLHFSCLLMGTSATVSLDTTEMEGFAYYFQLGSLFYNMKVYPDFDPGTISIDLATDLDNNGLSNLPTAYDLSQNYPNPFNPSTSIAFALPERSHVALEVFNVLGQKVRQLIDETLPAGNHSIVFDGHDNDGRELASGIYLYRIKTDGYSRSKKMMLMK
jgi:hypothetical protein